MYFKRYLNSLNLKSLDKWSILNTKMYDKGILKLIGERKGHFEPISGWKVILYNL